MRDVSEYNVTVDTVAPCADPSAAAVASAHALHANLERGLTMTHVPRTNKRVYGPRDSLEMSFVEDYIPAPPPSGADALKRKSLGLTPGLGRSTSELGASNDSAGTGRTAASSTTCASDSKSLDRFGLARPRISVDTVSTSERSLTIDCITCEEPPAVNVDDSHDDDDTSDRSKHRRPVESIMKYKTHEESIKHSYESSRRKHLKKQTQKKKKKRASIKRNRLSGTALARMGRRVGSLPNMKRALSSVVRLGSTTNANSDSPDKASEEFTSAQAMPRGGETNADWASPPVPAATATEASTGNIFLDMLEKKEAKDMEIDEEDGADSIPTISCNDGAVSAALIPSVTPSTSVSTAPAAPAISSTKESTGNIFLDMLKQQEEQQRSGVDRAITPPLLGLSQFRAVSNSSNLASTSTSNTTTAGAGAGLVFDPRLTKVRDVGNGNLTPSETSNISEGPLHSTDEPVENKHPLLDSSGIPSARPRRTGRRASYGDVSDLRKNVNFAAEELSHPKKSKKRLSFSSVSKAFNDSLASLLSNGSKSQGDGIDNDEEDDDEHIKKTVLQFSTLEIREYDTQLDINPSVSCGPAMALSWSYTVSARVPVERYEENRPPRRKMREMRVPASEREFRLRMSGVSRKEIEESIKSIERARKKRRKAIRQMKNDTMHEKLEGARRKLLKLLGRKKSQKQKEQELWENAQYYFASNTTSK